MSDRDENCLVQNDSDDGNSPEGDYVVKKSKSKGESRDIQRKATIDLDKSMEAGFGSSDEDVGVGRESEGSSAATAEPKSANASPLKKKERICESDNGTLGTPLLNEKKKQCSYDDTASVYNDFIPLIIPDN